MASVIKAGNATDGVQVTSDNTGILELKTGTGAGTTAVTVNTSQNVGIGTSSPADILHLSKAGDLYLRVANTSTGINAYLGQDSNGTYIGNTGASVVRFIQGASERMRLDTSGNLALGVTPSAWRSTYKALQTNGGSFYGFTSNDRVGMSQNAYVDATSFQWTYTTTAAATNYLQISGEHQWYRAASGTAGNAITFTQAMTLDASGILLVGTTSASASLAAGGLQVTDRICVGTGSVGTPSLHASGDTNTGLYFPGADIVGFATGGTERARITAAGGFTCAGIYNTTVGATNRDVFVDNTGVVGYVASIREAKTNIQDLTDTSWLHQLNPVTFHYRKKDEEGNYTDETDGDIQYGMIAEDVEQVRPDLCFYDEVDGQQELRGIQYSKLVPAMLKEIQKLRAEIEALKGAA